MEKSPKNINRRQKPTVHSAPNLIMYSSYQHCIYGHPLYLLVAAERVVACSFSHKKHRQTIQTFSSEQPDFELSHEPLPDQFRRPLINYLTGKIMALAWPRDELLLLRGSPFQRMVWKYIAAIPYGETCCYGEIARQMGGRKYARAVGGACNANPLALLIPCHRVVARKGLGGFAADRTIKEKLLQLEAGTFRAGS